MRCYFSLLSYPYVRAAILLRTMESVFKKKKKHEFTFIFPHKNAVHTNLIRIQLHFILFITNLCKQITLKILLLRHTLFNC